MRKPLKCEPFEALIYKPCPFRIGPRKTQNDTKNKNLKPAVGEAPGKPDFLVGFSLRACLKIAKGAAAGDFGFGQGGEVLPHGHQHPRSGR